jgi:hypothetical protein
MPVPVSKETKSRLNKWKVFFGRERKPMSAIVSIALALMLAFGGVGTTAYAAQDSLPSEPLYPVKEFTEQFRLALTTDTEAEVQLLLDLVEERVGEMISLANTGETIPEQTQHKLHEQLRLALTQATQLGDSELAGVLQRVRTMAQDQIQTMTQALNNQPADSPCEALQLAIRTMNRVKNEAEDGLEDPATFRLRQGTNRPEDAPDQPDNEPPGKQGPQSEGENDTAGQGNKNGPGEGNRSTGSGSGDSSGDGSGSSGNGNGSGPKGDGKQD